MGKLRNLFIYCGVSRDEYRSVKIDAYKSNFDVWKYLHVFLTFVFAVLTADSAIKSGYGAPLTIGRIIMCAYFAIVTILFFFVFRSEKILPQFIIYLTMVLLIVVSVWHGLEPENRGTMEVTFGILLVVLPMFMIDKPFYMAIVLTASSSVYMWHSYYYKPAVFHNELLNVIIFGLLGIAINVFYNSLRIKEFLLAKKNEIALVEQEKAMEKSRKMNAALQSMSSSLIEVLGDIVESRDIESGEHIQRVKGFTYILAKQVQQDLPEYGLDDYTVNLIAFASSLHDVGKISISDTILLKPGRLTAEEFEIMKTHCEKGCDVLEKMRGRWSEEYLQMSLDICGCHHEKWDGKGYPKGLKGDDIPIAAQIVSVADTYDALTSKRVYKDAYSCEKAIEMLMNGECGAYSDKMKACLEKVADRFEEYSKNPASVEIEDTAFEVVGSGNGFVVGIHDEDRSLKERLRLSEELSVLTSLSEKFLYVCYVDMKENEVYRFKAEPTIEKMLDSFGPNLRSNERFDKLLNTLIIADDYEHFRRAVDRDRAMEILKKTGHVAVGFRIRLEDGVHYCRIRITPDANDANYAIIGMMNVDEEHEREIENMELHAELEATRDRIESRKQLQDQLAVMNSICGNYDYVCALNTDTMETKVYKAEEWIRDMFKNLDAIVSSPEVRDEALKGIIHPDDYEFFVVGSRHENVLKGLKEGGGRYRMDYRAYRYGKLIHYQTKYTLDRDNPHRIIIGLHSIDDFDFGD